VGPYDRTIILRWLVVQKGCSLLPASWLAWPTRLVDGLPFRTQRSVFPQSLARSVREGSTIDPRQGSVSVGVWQMACRRVIKVGERTVKNILGKFSLLISITYPNVPSAVPSEPIAVPETNSKSL
jgi:hypothetical protein